MSDETPNSIDRQLRDVPVPPGLLPRLRDIAALGDVEIDDRLRGIPIPDGMLDRLREVVTLSDVEIDRRLRDVPLPRGMHKRVERSRRHSTRWAQLIGWAVAASLLAIVTGVLYWSSGNPQVAEPSAEFSHAKRTAIPESSIQSKPSKLASNDVHGPKNGAVVSATHVARPVSPTPNEQASTATTKHDTTDMTHENNVATDELDEFPVRAMAPDPSRSRQRSIFGGALPEIPPSLQEVEEPQARGISGPHVEGYDLVSELRTGRHPFVVPAVRPALRDSHVPVWTDTSSFELACRSVATGQLPPPAQIHTEDFLAAMNYRFPLPTSAPVGIRTAAGPAPWGPSGMSVMQIGIQAAKAASQPAGKPKIIADGVDIKVSFDPAAVSRYRLIGYEVSGGGGLLQAPLETDLRSGQATTALYEVELKPNGPTEVAFVEVSWRDPINETSHRIRQPIGRLQFLPSWRECALSLQEAVIAAEAAESLRNSNLSAASARGLDQAADLLSEINPALENRPEIVRLRHLIQQARTAKSARPAAAASGT